MSKRAEEKAMEAYPDTKIWVIGISGPVEATPILREKFQEGYEQAEKDLGWISVKDRLPEKSGYCITCVEQNGVPQCVGITLFNGRYWEDDDYPVEKELVDYWMPIPELPKEEEK